MVISIIFPLILLVVGFFVYRSSRRNFNLGSESDSWPTIQGTITSAQVQRCEGNADSEHPGSDTYVPQVKYQYEVHGVTYVSDRLCFGGSVHYSEESARRKLSLYSEGKPATVFYHPKKPQLSTLQPGFES
jgi:hypothetical protein